MIGNRMISIASAIIKHSYQSYVMLVVCIVLGALFFVLHGKKRVEK